MGVKLLPLYPTDPNSYFWYKAYLDSRVPLLYFRKPRKISELVGNCSLNFFFLRGNHLFSYLYFDHTSDTWTQVALWCLGYNVGVASHALWSCELSLWHQT